jgi:hypothetical protein
MEYFAHRVLPTSTLPVITLPVSILHVMYLHREDIARLYFASGTLPVSVKEVVLYQWVPCLQWAKHWRAKYYSISSVSSTAAVVQPLENKPLSFDRQH